MISTFRSRKRCDDARINGKRRKTVLMPRLKSARCDVHRVNLFALLSLDLFLERVRAIAKIRHDPMTRSALLRDFSEPYENMQKKNYKKKRNRRVYAAT